jgi:hypothetical protein
MTTTITDIDNLINKLDKSDLNDTFKEKIISDLKNLIKKNLNASDEGSTSDGKHESEVSKILTSYGWIIVKKKYITDTKNKKIYLMNRNTHTPTDNINCEEKDGYYQIPQPYSDGRGSFNPAPDIYLINVRNKKIVEWMGLECKSSKSMKPMLNDNVFRDFNEGNIIYLFSGSKNGKNINMLTTGRIFVNNNDPKDIGIFYNDINKIMQKLWIDKKLNTKFPMYKCFMRQKCELSKDISEDEVKEYTQKTFKFLDTIKLFSIQENKNKSEDKKDEEDEDKDEDNDEEEDEYEENDELDEEEYNRELEKD